MDLKRQKRTFRVPRINVLGVGVDDFSEKKTVDAIVEMVKRGKRGKYVVTVNAEFVMQARRNRKFGDILNDAHLAVADGQWVVWAKLILGGKEHDRITGVDLVERLCEKAKDLPIRLGFLGGFGDVADRVMVRQVAANPGLKVVLAEPGDPSIGYDSRLKERLERIGSVDILFVAYGMGQQEFWIDRVKNRLPVGVFIGVGGAFDYLSGVKKRPPIWLQNAGLEWFWRLLHDPVRIWRMRVLPVFVLLISWKLIKQKLNFG